MADDLWVIRVVLSNGDTRQVAMAGRRAEAIEDTAKDFMAARGEFQGDWLKTSEGGVIARAHIVEVQSVVLKS
ncbi:MAG TPA: hypothetical protein VFA42_09100 [Gaiellaceae bacterium]|nr:hypothetical protein [Gaiellaceae bacterium]